MRISLEQATGRARQIGAIEPGIAGQARHEDDEVGRDITALGPYPICFEAGELMAEMGGDVPPFHLRQETFHRCLAETVAGVGHGVEKHQFDLVTAPLAPQLGIESKQEFEDRAAAHGRRLIRITGKAQRDRTVLKRLEPIAYLHCCANALARGDGVLDPRQLLDKASTAGDDQAVVVNGSVGGDHGTTAIRQPCGLAGMKVDMMLFEKILKRNDQIACLTQPGRNPDEAGQVNQYRPRGDDGNGGLAVKLTQLAGGGQCREAGTDYRNSLHMTVLSERVYLRVARRLATDPGKCENWPP